MHINLKYFENTAKLIPLISILFFLGSLWYEGLFYSTFGINIFAYVSLTETLNLFIEKLPFMVVASLFVFLFFLGFQTAFEDKLVKLFNTTFYNRKRRMQRFFQLNYITMIIMLIPLMSFMVFLPTLFRGIHKTEGFLLSRAAVVFVNIYWFLNLSITYSKNRFSNSSFSFNISALTIIVTFFVVIYYSHLYEILKIKQAKISFTDPSYSIKLKSQETIKCNDSTIYLGKTNDFLFVLHTSYNSVFANTRIISMNEVDEINITKAIRWYKILP